MRLSGTAMRVLAMAVVLAAMVLRCEAGESAVLCKTDVHVRALTHTASNRRMCCADTRIRPDVERDFDPAEG